jgi:hypothetical protein
VEPNHILDFFEPGSKKFYISTYRGMGCYQYTKYNTENGEYNLMGTFQMHSDSWDYEIIIGYNMEMI